MPKWKPNAKAFPVAVNYSDVRGYQTTVPKPVMEVLGSPPKITFRIFRGRVVVEAGDSTVIPTPHGNGLDRFSEPPPTGPAYPLYRFDGQPVAATAMVGDPVAGEVHGEWGFKDADTKELTHGIHPYPARLIPQVARKLLLTYARPKAMVWDPFCGSGTVLLESMTHDHPSVGTDLNPFACLLARAKTTVILAPQLAKWSDMIAARLRSKGVEEALKRYQPNLSDFTLEVDKWWKPTVVRDLGFIRDQIAQVPGISRNTALAALLDVAFSRTVRDVSNQRPNEFKRYRRPEDELKDFTPDPISVFLTRWSETIAAVTRLTPAYDGAPRDRVGGLRDLQPARGDWVDPDEPTLWRLDNDGRLRPVLLADDGVATGPQGGLAGNRQALARGQPAFHANQEPLRVVEGSAGPYREERPGAR
jgi:Putative RNA methylase family UPF0020